MTELTQSRLKELLHYCPDTGVFTWLVRTSNRVKIGDEAGCFRSNGYRQIMVDGKKRLAHRMAWLYVTGEWPAHQIDHINGVRDDNRRDNLREATNAQNQQNAAISSANTSGYKGVSWHRRAGKWRARITISWRIKHLGYFTTQEDAVAAYLAAKAVHHTFQPTVRGQIA